MVSLKVCMSLFVIASVCSFVESADIAYNNCHAEGYYWRDFHGEIPSDALPGGADTAGRPIYIGQVYARFLIPAKIYSFDKQVYYEYGGKEHKVTQNIKILCTQHPEQFEWIKTNNNDISLISDKNLVIGGFEPGCTTYIGRVRAEGEILVGKALADNPPQYAGLHITKNGKAFDIRHLKFWYLMKTLIRKKFLIKCMQIYGVKHF